MSGPKDGRGGDAFDDFFGDPSPSGRMGPAAEQHPKSNPGESPTARMDAGGGEDTPTQATPAAEPSYEPTVATGAVPESWWATESEPTATAAASTWDTTSEPPRPDRKPPRKGVSPLGLVAMLIGGVLLGGLCVGGLAMTLGGDDQQPAAQETVTETDSPTSTTEPSESSSDTSSSSSSSSSSTSSSSSSSSTTAERTGQAPSGVSECAGPSGGVAVGTATDVTSCEFALAVRDAYVAGNSNGAASLRVTSPVTSKAYTMSCSGDSVTRCTGGNNAVVVLY